MSKKYKLTETHRAQLAPWADRWNANARSTQAMDDTDRAAMKAAINGLYEAADMPHPKQIVFVGSPLVAAVAGGIAAGVWYLAEHQYSWFEADFEQLETAWSAVRIGTQKATRVAMEEAIRTATRKSAQLENYAAMPSGMRDLVWTTTEDALNEVTHSNLDKALYAAMAAAAAAAAAAAGTASVTPAPAAAAAMKEPSTAHTPQTAVPATATGAIWEAATAAVQIATAAAMPATPDEATRVAIAEATLAAVRAATHDVPNHATPDLAQDSLQATVNWATGFLVDCISLWYCMYNGGNQWSSYAAHLGFYADVAKLNLPECGKWRHYQAATAHGGPRMMHNNFCMVSDRPETLQIDANYFFHCDVGPTHRWRDGWKLFFINGRAVTSQIVMSPETLTVQQILEEENRNVRAIMIERFGFGRFVRESGGCELHADQWGTLWQTWADELLLFVDVVIYESDAQGNRKPKWRRADPELRPLSSGVPNGKPQALTGLNAAASVMGMTGKQYLHFLGDDLHRLQMLQS